MTHMMSRYYFRHFRYLCVPTTHTTVILFLIEQSDRSRTIACNLGARDDALIEFLFSMFSIGHIFFIFFFSLVITQPCSCGDSWRNGSFQFSLTENFQTLYRILRSTRNSFSLNYFRDCAHFVYSSDVQMQPKSKKESRKRDGARKRE